VDRGISHPGLHRYYLVIGRVEYFRDSAGGQGVAVFECRRTIAIIILFVLAIYQHGGYISAYHHKH
jgi:hypothetical protein